MTGCSRHNEAMGFEDDLRRKLKRPRIHAPAEAAALPEPSAVADLRRRLRKTPAPIVFRRDLPRSEKVAPLAPSSTPGMRLAEAVPGAEIAAPNGARVYLIAQPVANRTMVTTARPATGAVLELSAALREALANPASGLRRRFVESGFAEAPRAEDLLFLDLETTGLGASPLFLIGTLSWEDSGLLVRQFFARDYAEERAALECFLERAANHKLLVTFNGKSFDVPYLRMRAAANGVPCRLDHAHLDLLHASRRIWKDRFGDCRLQTLEYHVCGRRRHGDIPGAEIGEAYHAYVRTGDARKMAAVVNHNRQDLLTLAEILVRMPPPGDDPPLGDFGF